MGSLRVVLLAEGSGEVRATAFRGPDSPIHRDDWGAGHVLMARAIEAARGLPRAAVQFAEPRRTSRATVAKGSNLHDRRTLRQLINYLPSDRPNLIIVLVDADGLSGRKAALENAIEDIPGAKIVACAVQEFEAWLVSDSAALAEVLQCDPSRAVSNPEGLARDEAKTLLKALSASVPDARLARISLAEHLDLKVVASRCPSFATCLSELKALQL